MKRILLRNLRIVRPFDVPALIEGGEILIEDGIIASVGPPGLEPPPDTSIINMAGRTVLPGMINAHTHLYSALALGMPGPSAPPANFVQILERVWWKLDRALDPDSTRASFRAGLLASLRGGVTTVIDHHSSPSFTEGSLALLAEEADRFGVNAALAFEVTDRNGEAAFERGLKENLEAWKAFRDHPNLHPMLGLHASFTLGDASLQHIAEALSTHPGLAIHIHLAEDRADETDARGRGYASIVERLDHFGLLAPGAIVAHGLYVRPEDVDTLRERGVYLVHNPTSNANNRVGLLSKATIDTLRAGLGTDGMQANLLAEAKEGTLVRSSQLNAGQESVDYTRLLFENNPRIASGLFGRPVGLLEEGVDADLAFYDYRPRTPVEAENLAGHLLFGLDCPVDVMTHGVFRLRNGHLVGMDEDIVMEEARHQAKRLWRAMQQL